MTETIWKQLMKLNSPDVLNQLKLYYGNFLPMEVRYHLAEWIENTVFKLICIDPQSLEYDLMSNRLQNDFITEMIHKTEQMITDDLIPTKARFDEAIKRFQYMNATELFSQLVEIFRRECQLLSDFLNGNYAAYVSGSKEIDKKIEKLKENVSMFNFNHAAKWTKNFFNYQEEYYMINSNNSPLTNGGSPTHPIEVNLHTSSLTYMTNMMKKIQSDIGENVPLITRECDEILTIISDDFITQWKSYQQKCGNNDFSINGANIDKLNDWCTELAKLFVNLYETIKSIEDNLVHLPNDVDNFSNVLMSQNQVVLNLLMKLIRESLIVESHPPQVIKTNTRFTAVIRLLVGEALNNKIVNGVAKASIVSEMQAKNIANIEASCGEIANHNVNLELRQKSLTGNFKSMLLKNFKRMGKKSCEMVTDEKFAIVFAISLQIYGKELKEKILSLPIVVTVHGSQETNAWATILWHNAFTRTNQKNFSASETITWKEFSEALSHKFESVVGRGLTEENLHFLAEKLYSQVVPYPVPKDFLVTWTAFCKEKLHPREFTFWEWFYACLKLTKDYLKTAWNEGRIVGFINKRKTEDELIFSPHGTFLLRFSDSELGALSIAWLNSEDSTPLVSHIRPINGKEFELININQRIHDVDELIYLHPNIPKHEAFRLDRNSHAPGDYISFRTVMRVDIRRK